MVEYLSVEKVVELNVLAISMIAVKKGDQAKLLSKLKLQTVLETCKEHKGSLYEKAAFLLKEITQKHPFASGNRRTAFLAMKFFLISNGQKFKIDDNPANARILQGIRESYFSDFEIVEWIKNGKIREFRR